MNKSLIKNWNMRVAPEDTTFILGDFCFKYNSSSPKSIEYEKALNGKCIFIMGNHDRNNSTKTIIKHSTIYIGGKNILLIHRPNDVEKWNISLSGIDLILCGHVHNAWKIKFPGEYYSYNKKARVPTINMSVDVWNFKPVEFPEIERFYNKERKNLIHE
jgi:calcineurin-like phosphoesterase family protein